ncbi:MAG: hypothetical protein K6E51_00705 [Treponema sp.]|nr:hypothetical protein [Treponema sp.]
MPGLDQLRKLSEDILALGNESVIRASRGEKPVRAEIPTNISEASDADDFVLGVPEKKEQQSDSAGNVSDAESISEAAPVDMDTLDSADEGNSGPSDIPNLDDILGGGVGNVGLDDLDLSGFLDDSAADAAGNESPLDAIAQAGDAAGEPGIDGLNFDESPLDALAQDNNDSGDFNLDDVDLDALDIPDVNEPSAAEIPPVADSNMAEPAASEVTADTGTDDFDLSNLDIPEASSDSVTDFDLNDIPGGLEAPADDSESADIPSFDIPAESGDTATPEASSDIDFNLDDLDISDPTASSDIEKTPAPENLDVGADTDFTIDNLDISDTDSMADSTVSAAPEIPGSDDTPVPENLDIGSDTDFNIDIPDSISDGEAAEAPEDTSDTDFNLDDLDMADSGTTEDVPAATEDFDAVPMPSLDEEEAPSVPDVDFSDAGASEAVAGIDDLDMPDMNTTGDASDGFDMANLDFDMGTDDMSADIGGEMSMGVEAEDSGSIDDTGGLSDFEIPDTDSTLENGASDFELANPDDFEIPNFTNIEGEADLSKKETVEIGKEEAAPRTTLTDEEYEKFKANLTTYPLNVRIAVEELIAKDEFTDDVVFEVIDKVLKKVSARQLATHLEKLLDISIAVPRDYERRSFAEYEAYKSSIKYQLLNRVIPMAIAGLVVAMIGMCLFFVTDRFVYRPLKANSLYKQGYALLESDEYPQSEMKFQEAVSYHANKKWFFRYAVGYKNHKQYSRAETMYERILGTFDFDKQAGLEYAYMEMADLANYERAEKIVRRYVLDHYINDKDGILLLGDIYLEWAGEKDESKFDDARTQYASLIQLYGSNDLYLSRMMRYFIRIDNLREVLQLKEHFFPRPKSLGADDLTELSGYLLEKEYGELAPSEEYLRAIIEDVRPLLERAVKADPANPVAQYNLASYFVKTDNRNAAIATMQETIATFDKVPTIKKKDMNKRIDAYRQLGELYVEEHEYLKAEEVYSKGIGVYQQENEISGFEGNKNVGVLYSDMGDIDYYISGNMDNALRNYNRALQIYNDVPEIRYKVGVIQYGKQDYTNALGSFIKASEVVHNDNNLLLALGNVLALRNDNYAAQGYYQTLLDNIAMVRNRLGILFPHERDDEARLVDLYMRASNNLGVAQYRIAHQTGDSSLNGQAIVHLSESLNAWDALTRNPETLVRIGGSNLAEQNIRYIAHPYTDFAPAIYVDIPRTLTYDKGIAK